LTRGNPNVSLLNDTTMKMRLDPHGAFKAFSRRLFDAG
jgi:hypothetical protein